jgi:hypothetical protein
MMDEARQKIFTKQLHSVMAGLLTSRADPKQRAFVRNAVQQMMDKTRAKSWLDIKRGLDAQNYDSVLTALQDGAKNLKQQNEPLGVRAMEALGVSLIARHQSDETLKPVVRMLDEYIENCVARGDPKPKRSRPAAPSRGN